MDRRKEELEKKRQKLAELRRAREERKQVLMIAQQKEPKDKKDLDELIDSLVDTKRQSISYAAGNAPDFVSLPHTPTSSFDGRRSSFVPESVVMGAENANNQINVALLTQNSGYLIFAPYVALERKSFQNLQPWRLPYLTCLQK